AVVGGSLHSLAAIPLGLLLAAAYAAQPQRPRTLRIRGHVVLGGAAIGLGFHRLPGFEYPQVIAPGRPPPDAVTFTLYLNLDKRLAGFWLLLVSSAICLHHDRWSWLHGFAIGAVTAVVCLGAALALGEISFAPKWPAQAWLWALNNLLLVCLTEEALF